jgi:hypothetical protein
MAYEFRLEQKLNQDMLPKNKNDQNLIGRLQLIAGTKQNPNQKSKSNLVFLLDSSSSMDEAYYATGRTKRQVVFDAVQSLMSSIDGQDTVSFISFHSQAILRGDHVPGSAKSAITSILNEYLNDNGATNFEDAMEKASAICNSRSNESHKLIFLTDGNANTGSNQRALDLCRQLATKGHTTDAMGIGGDFDFNFMKQFSDMSGSITENIIQPKQAESLFKKIYQSAGNTFLKKVFLNIFFQKGVRDIHFFMHMPEKKNLHQYAKRHQDGTLVTVNAGDIEQNDFKEYIFSCTVDTPNAPNMHIAEITVNYDCPSENIQNGQSKQSIHLNLGSDPSQIINFGDVNTAWKDIEILIEQEEALKLAEKGKYAEAALRLEQMADKAASLGDRENATALRELANKVKRDHNLTQADLNRISKTSSTVSARSTMQSSAQQADSALF